MSVSTEITRLENAKASIITAIEGKEVTVPSGTKLDGLSALIDDISLGVDTNDATATSSDVVSGKTFYSGGEKRTGTLVVQTYYYGASNPTDSLGVNGDLYFKMEG